MQGSESDAEADNFYALLNLEPTATPEQIKRSYRKLALRFHPDKNPSTGEMFQKISTAYATLSNPQRRQVYDRFGEQGVQMMEQAEAHGVPAWLLNPVAQSSLLLVLLVTVLLLLVVLPIITCMRVDGGLSWPWPAVLTPIWLANALLLTATIAGGAREHSEGGGGRCGGWCGRLSAPSATHVNLLLLFACEVLVALKIDSPDTVAFSFSVALSPLTALLVLRVVRALVALGPAAAGCGAGEETEPAQGKAAARSALGGLLLWRGLLLAAVVLLGARLDEAPGVAWWGVLMPAWGLMALVFVQSAALFASTRETAQQEERMARRTLALGSVLVGLLASSSLLLLSLRLASVPISAAHILTPYFVVLGLVACCGVLACLVGAAAAAAEEGAPASRGVRMDPADSAGHDGASGRSAGSGEADTAGGDSTGERADGEVGGSVVGRGGSEARASSGAGAAGGAGPRAGGGVVVIDVDDVVGLGQRLRSADVMPLHGLGGRNRADSPMDRLGRGRYGGVAAPAGGEGGSAVGVPAGGASPSRGAGATAGAPPFPRRSEAELRGMGIRELKAELLRCNVSSAGMLEKGDLLSLALGANRACAPTGGGVGRTSPKNLLD